MKPFSWNLRVRLGSSLPQSVCSSFLEGKKQRCPTCELTYLGRKGHLHLKRPAATQTLCPNRVPSTEGSGDPPFLQKDLCVAFSLPLLKSRVPVRRARKSQLQPGHLNLHRSPLQTVGGNRLLLKVMEVPKINLFRNGLKRRPDAQGTSGNQLGQAEVGFTECPPSPPCLYTPCIVIHCLSFMYLYVNFSVFTCPLPLAFLLCRVFRNQPLPVRTQDCSTLYHLGLFSSLMKAF